MALKRGKTQFFFFPNFCKVYKLVLFYWKPNCFRNRFALPPPRDELSETRVRVQLCENVMRRSGRRRKKWLIGVKSFGIWRAERHDTIRTFQNVLRRLRVTDGFVGIGILINEVKFVFTLQVYNTRISSRTRFSVRTCCLRLEHFLFGFFFFEGKSIHRYTFTFYCVHCTLYCELKFPVDIFIICFFFLFLIKSCKGCRMRNQKLHENEKKNVRIKHPHLTYVITLCSLLKMYIGRLSYNRNLFKSTENTDLFWYRICVWSRRLQISVRAH